MMNLDDLRNQVLCMDALELLRALPDSSVDMVLTDMPYGLTACTWDTVIDLVAWWPEVWRVCKPRAAVVCTASQPFTTALISSALSEFRYEWVWIKARVSGFLNVKFRPLVTHESVLIFYHKAGTYNPQMRAGEMHTRGSKSGGRAATYGKHIRTFDIDNQYYPRDILYFSQDAFMHSTQKPVALFEYMIRTYTEPVALVVDPFVGSGTTAIAARNTKRDYICGDLSAEYVAIARERLDTTPYKPIDATGDDVTDLPLFARADEGAG